MAGGRCSHAPIIAAPVLDALLDLFAIQIFFESLLGQCHYLAISGEAEAYELIFAEAINLRMPFGWGEGLQSQALFEADDAILHLERINTRLERKQH
jgi:hypothetical protein